MLIPTCVLFSFTTLLAMPRLVPGQTTAAPEEGANGSNSNSGSNTTSGGSTSSGSNSKTPLLAVDFPDPCIVRDPLSGTWYGFGTGSWQSVLSDSTGTTTFKNIQAASAPALGGPWTYLPDANPLPTAGNWTSYPQENPTTDTLTWAPSVVRINLTAAGDTSQTYQYVMYYSALHPSTTINITTSAANPVDNTTIVTNTTVTTTDTTLHCIGAALSPPNEPLGPYTPLPTPLICPLSQGGAIDPSGFVDPATGRRYILYKVDGNSLGGGGECNNGVSPERGTPIMLQEVDALDGVTLIGEPVQVLDRDAAVDGPLVEAPELALLNGDKDDDDGGVYVLLYSNHCWDGPLYSVNYAVSKVADGGSVKGPFKRAVGAKPLIQTGDGFNITAPGGAAWAEGGGWIVFHGNCEQGRCLFGAAIAAATNGNVTVS